MANLMVIEAGEQKNSGDIEKHKAKSARLVSALLCILNRKLLLFRNLAHDG